MLERSDRLAVARAWARAGEFEQASVGAFVQLAEHLRAHGAPLGLVERCDSAAADERDHTQRCFALASRYAATRVRPGRLASTSRRFTPSMTQLADESIRDGIVNEGFAALLASTQLEVATDADVRSTLTVIARDEALHAELAWAILDWCLEAGGADVRRVVATADLPPVLTCPHPIGLTESMANAHGVGAPAALASTWAELRATIAARLDSLVPADLVAASA